MSGHVDLERGADALMEQLQFTFAAKCLQRAAQILRYAIATNKSTDFITITEHKLAFLLSKLAACHLAIGDRKFSTDTML